MGYFVIQLPDHIQYNTGISTRYADTHTQHCRYHIFYSLSEFSGQNIGVFFFFFWLRALLLLLCLSVIILEQGRFHFGFYEYDRLCDFANVVCVK